jgi:hypothetical protein
MASTAPERPILAVAEHETADVRRSSPKVSDEYGPPLRCDVENGGGARLLPARDADPSLGVRNCAAPGRSATWTEGEVARLFKHAWRTGYHGLAAVTAVMSSTQMSPGDVRTSRASQLAPNANGAMFFTARGKTGVPVGGALSDQALAALQAYIGRLGVDLHGEARCGSQAHACVWSVPRIHGHYA